MADHLLLPFTSTSIDKAAQVLDPFSMPKPDDVRMLDTPLTPHPSKAHIARRPSFNATSHNRHAPKVWERHRNTIVAYYQDHSLSELETFMKDHHDFEATAMAYKKKLARWRGDQRQNNNVNSLNARSVTEHPVGTFGFDHFEPYDLTASHAHLKQPVLATSQMFGLELKNNGGSMPSPTQTLIALY